MPPYASHPTRWRPTPYSAPSAQAQPRPYGPHNSWFHHQTPYFPLIHQRNTYQPPLRPLPHAQPTPQDSFLQGAIQKLEFALGKSYAPQTDRNYNGAINRYLKFASRCGVPAHDALPSPPFLIALWIASGVGQTGPGTAKNNLSALTSWHKTHGFPFETPIQMPTIKRAIRLHWPRENRKPPRPPVTPGMIRMLTEEWSDGSPLQLCALAIALTSWGGQLRLGEILPPSSREVDRKRLPTRESWIASPLSPKASRLILPWTKTTNFDGATIHLIEQNYPFDPSQAIYRHLRCSNLPPSALICEYRAENTTKTLDKATFMESCNDVWSRHGLPRITGHSFRIGGTTALLRNHVDPDVVKQMGRWSSSAFLLYWRDLEEIFTSHASRIDWIDFVI